MPTKSSSDEVELKVRIPRALFQEVNDYRHEKKCDSRKEAVVMLLRAGLDKPDSVPTEAEASE